MKPKEPLHPSCSAAEGVAASGPRREDKGITTQNKAAVKTCTIVTKIVVKDAKTCLEQGTHRRESNWKTFTVCCAKGCPLPAIRNVILNINPSFHASFALKPEGQWSSIPVGEFSPG